MPEPSTYYIHNIHRCIIQDGHAASSGASQGKITNAIPKLPPLTHTTFTYQKERKENIYNYPTSLTAPKTGKNKFYK